MFYVYVLQSQVDGRTYVGCTKDLRRRFKEHNAGECLSTAYRRPLNLIYYEAFRDFQDARDRELSLKNHGKVMEGLKRRILRSLGSVSDDDAGVGGEAGDPSPQAL